MNLKQQIKAVLLEIDRLVAEMMTVSQMVGASFGIAHRKCGKSNCRCNSDQHKGHPVLRITFTEKQKSKTKAIPKKDEQWIKEMTDNYRNFRQNFQKLRSCEKQLNDLLNELEQVIKTKTRALRDYL